MASTDIHAGIIPVVDEPTKEELSLPLKSKLELIEDEIRQLHNFCLQSGLNTRQIELYSSTLHETTKTTKWPKGLLFLTLAVAFVAFLFQFDPTYRFLCVQGRLLSIKLLPYWDWTNIYEEDCFIANPYVKDNELSEKDCIVCKSIDEITVMSNASVDDVADDFLLKNIPLIVDDALDNWPAKETFSTEFLSKLYRENEDLTTQNFCQFLSSVEDISSPMELFQYIINIENSRSWQASWENCNPSAAKVIRKFYKRPYFIPLMAEAAESNWIFLASGRNKEHKGQQNSVAFGGNAAWVAQISGEIIVKLEPRAPCDTACQPVSGVLKAGQTLLFTSYLWEFTFYPVGEEAGVSISSSVIWDML